jgi:hypothetical protein
LAEPLEPLLVGTASGRHRLDGSRLAQHWPLAVLLLIPLLILWRSLFLGETLFYQDLGAQYFPRERLLMRTGLTGWNPHIFLGMSLAAEPQSAAYEPVRALARALGFSDVAGLVMFVIVYLTLAAVGFYAFALRKGASPIGASAAVLTGLWGGAYVVRFRHPHLFTSMCMIPWVALSADLLLVERRLVWALALGVLTTVGALGGGPQGPYMLWLLVAGYLGVGVALTIPAGTRLSAVSSLAWRTAAGAVAFAGLSAIQLLPAAILVSHTTRRDANATLAFVGAYSFNPWDWARLIAPDLYGNDMAGTYFGSANYHEQTVYLGVAPLLLLVLALIWRRRTEPERSLLALSLGWLVVAAGRFLPLFYLAYFAIPGWRLFRCPARYSWFFALAAATVVGLSVTRIAGGEHPPEPERARRLLRRVWLPLAALCVALAIALGPWLDRLIAPGVHTTMRWAAGRAALLLGLCGLLLDAWLRGAISGRRTSVALIALTVVDLGLQWLPYRQTLPPADAFPSTAITRALADAAPGRVLVHVYRGDGLPEIVPLLNWGEAAGYDDLRGYNQLVPSDLLELLQRADIGQLANPKHYALAPVDAPDWLLDLTAVRRIVARPGDWPARWRSLPRVARGGGYEVRERPGAIPRAWLVGAAERLAGPAALERLAKLDVHHVAIVDADVGLPPDSRTPPGKVRWIARSADDLALEVDALTPGLLVLADRFDRGWSATVDGRRQPIVRTDYLLRGVRVQPGTHAVRMHFTVAGKTAAGRVTSATAVFVSLLVLAVGRRRLGAGSRRS